MYPPSSTKEKVFGAGTLLLFSGIVGTAFLDLHGIPRTISVFCLVVGCVLHTAGFIALVPRENPVSAANQSPDGAFWLRLLVIALWLGVLPFVGLWVYHRIHRP
jgi:hypothetical protein